MLNRLCGASVFRTSGISTKYTIRRSERDIERRVPSSHVHIMEQENSWRIYVPENKKDRELCYSLSFPETLAKLLGISPTAREILSNVLTKPIYILDDILEAEGIGKVPEVARPPRHSDADQEETVGEEITTSQETFAQLRSSGAQRSPVVEAIPSSSSPFAGRQSYGDPPDRNPETGEWTRAYNSRDAYRDLIENVIRLANQTSLPHLNSNTAMGDNDFIEGFDSSSTFGIRSQGQLSHDTKIGAAGEVFVSTVYSLPCTAHSLIHAVIDI